MNRGKYPRSYQKRPYSLLRLNSESKVCSIEKCPAQNICSDTWGLHAKMIRVYNEKDPTTKSGRMRVVSISNIQPVK